MRVTTVLLVVACLLLVAHFIGRRRAVSLAGSERPHSLPTYYGYYAAIWTAVPSLALITIYMFGAEALIIRILVAGLPEALRQLPDEQLGLVLNDIRNLATGGIMAGPPSPDLTLAAARYAELVETGRWTFGLACIGLGLGAMTIGLRRVRPDFKARPRVERVVRLGLLGASTLAIFTTVGILLSVLVEALRFFQEVPLTEFLFGLNWSPQTAIRVDQVGSSGAFGAVPLFVGTLLISLIALMVAVPLGLMSAIYLSEYSLPAVRAGVKPVLEVLAGIPTVVYGYFAAITIAPLLRDTGQFLGLDIASESALGAGLVMGIMIIPFVSSLSDDVMNAVPQAMRDGSLSLGATRSETIRRVVLPAALPGIVGGVLLAASRAIGETMIVVMAAGLAANLTANPFEAVTTVTVQIVTLLVGDQEFDSAKTLAAFALGLVLFVVTLLLNVGALKVVRKYREQYE